MRLLLSLSLFVLVLLVLPQLSSAAATLTVGNGTPASCTQNALEQVVNASSAGDTITFSCGGPATIYFTSSVWIQNNLTIDGGQMVTFDGQGTARPLICSRTQWPKGVELNCSLVDLTIINGYTSVPSVEISHPNSGGGIYVAIGGMLYLNRVTMRNCYANMSGGAIFFEQGNYINIQNSEFRQNTAAGDGGALFVGYLPQSTTLFNILFIDNAALGLLNNSGPGYGGAVHLSQATGLVQACQFRDNRAAMLGGGLYGLFSKLVVDSCVFSRGIAYQGAGAFEDGINISSGNGSYTVHNTSFEENQSYSAGGGFLICLYDSVPRDTCYIKNSQFCSNRLQDPTQDGVLGTALDNECNGNMYITDTNFGNNTAVRSGARTFWPGIGDAVVDVTHSTIPGYTKDVSEPGPACASIYNGRAGPAYYYGTPNALNWASSSSASRLLPNPLSFLY